MSDRVLTIRLEALVHDDREAMYARLLSFLEIDDAPEMRAFFESRMGRENAQAGAWREGMDEREQERIPNGHRLEPQIHPEGQAVPIDLRRQGPGIPNGRLGHDEPEYGRGEGQPERGERAPHRVPLSSRASVSTTPGGSRRQFPSGFAGSSFFSPQ